MATDPEGDPPLVPFIDGVEVLPAPTPEKIAFEVVDELPDKPATDVKIRLEDGTEFRERIERVDNSPAGETGRPAAGFYFSISNARLTADGNVEIDGDGNPMIVPPECRHEFGLTGEDMGRMTREQIEAAFTHGREVAAAKAQAYFRGMEMGRDIFAGRLEGV